MVDIVIQKETFLTVSDITLITAFLENTIRQTFDYYG